MSRIARLVRPAPVVAGIVAAGLLAACTRAAQAAGIVGTTISVSASFPAVAGERLVIYKAAGSDTATISGTVTGAPPRAKATLLARPFRARSFTAESNPIALRHASPARYSFTVQPSVATAYEVRITAGKNVVATSAVQTVYVAGGGRKSPPRQKCSRSSCTFDFPAYLFIPAPAYNFETHKHWYLYLEVGYPRLPGYFRLDSLAKASRVRKISADEFEVTFTFHIPLRNGSGLWETNFCTKDTESKDGMGLPGASGCGDKRVSAHDRYLG